MQRFVICVVLLTLLAACGGSSTPTGTSTAASAAASTQSSVAASTEASTAASAEASAEASTAASAEASTAASAAGEAAASAAAPPAFEVVSETADSRTVRHVFGETEIPLNPQRIVAADLGTFVPTTGVLAALGVKPVAITAQQLPPYLSQPMEGVQVLSGEVNYEAIAALKPDLIITPGAEYNRENYETLSQIAPTVAPFWYWQTLDQATSYWKAVATVVNKPAEGDKLVADLNSRVEAVRAKLEPRMQGKPVSVLQVQGKGLEAIYLQTGRLESALLHAVGVTRPANQTYDPNKAEWYVTLSPELLPEADAWAIFAEVYAADPNDIPQAKQDLESSALWGQLEAVKAKRVFYVATDEWSGTDPLLAQIVLNTIETQLTAALDAAGQ